MTTMFMSLKIRLNWICLLFFTISLSLACHISHAGDTLVLTTVMGSADVNAGAAVVREAYKRLDIGYSQFIC